MAVMATDETDNRELLTVADAAARFGIAEDKIRAWLRVGPVSGRRRLTKYQSGEGRVYVDAREIERLLRIEPA